MADELPSAINSPGINNTVKIRIVVLTSMPRTIDQRGAMAGINAKHMPIPNLRLQCMGVPTGRYILNLREGPDRIG